MTPTSPTRCAPAGRSCAARSASWPARHRQFSTSARASRPWATFTRSPSHQPEARSSTSNRPCRRTHAGRSWQGNDLTAVIQADVRDPHHVPTGRSHRPHRLHAAVRGVARRCRPLRARRGPSRQDPRGARDAIAPGSYLVISHSTFEDQPRRCWRRRAVREDATAITLRSRAEIAALLGDFEVLDQAPYNAVVAARSTLRLRRPSGTLRRLRRSVVSLPQTG